MAYSFCRMVGNRLARTQIIDIYRTDKLGHDFENVKADDTIEIINHFTACSHVLDTVMTPLNLDYIRNVHRDLTYGTYADRTNQITAGAFRQCASKARTSEAARPERISQELERLVRSYEKLKPNLESTWTSIC